MAAAITTVYRGQDMGRRGSLEQAGARTHRECGPFLERSPNPPPFPEPGGGRPETDWVQEPLSLPPIPWSPSAGHFGTHTEPAGAQHICEPLHMLSGHRKQWALQRE